MMPNLAYQNKIIPFLEYADQEGMSITSDDLNALVTMLNAYTEDPLEVGPIYSLPISSGVLWGQIRKRKTYLYAAEAKRTAPKCFVGEVWLRADILSRENIITEKKTQKPAKHWPNGVWGWCIAKGWSKMVLLNAEEGKLLGGWDNEGKYIERGAEGIKNNVLWGIVPEQYILGSAKVWRSGASGRGYWKIPQAIIRAQCEIRGWVKLNKTGKIMLRPGIYCGSVNPDSVEASVAYANGLRAPRIWPVGAIENLARILGPKSPSTHCAAYFDAMSWWCEMEAGAGYMTCNADMLRFVAEHKRQGWL